MDKPRLHKTLLRVLLVVILAAAGVLIVTVTVGRGPFSGASQHDFGLVLIADQPVVLEHTFRLRNRTGDTLVINDVRPSCGCTIVTTSTRQVDPDGWLEVTARLTLKRSGFQRVHIYIEVAERGTEMLTLEATGQRTQRLTSSQRMLRLRPGTPRTLVVFLEVHEDDQKPPAPKLTSPPGVAAAFVDWSQVQRRKRRKAIPARWAGRITVEQETAVAAEDAALVIDVEPDQRLEIPLDLAEGKPEEK